MFRNINLIRSNNLLTSRYLCVMYTLSIRHLRDRVQIEYATINCLNLTFQQHRYVRKFDR